MSLKDLFRATAEERGIALTDEEIDAEMSAAATSQVEALRKELAGPRRPRSGDESAPQGPGSGICPRRR
jgi:hypothetical protein